MKTQELKNELKNAIDNNNFSKVFILTKNNKFRNHFELKIYLERIVGVKRIDKFTNFLNEKGRQKIEISSKNNTKEVVNFAKWQIENNIKDNYKKILIVGNENIYWANKFFKHEDYNKSIAMTNNEKNRRIAMLINSYLTK